MTTDPKRPSRLLPPRRSPTPVNLLLAAAVMTVALLTTACGDKAAPVASDPNFYKVSREDLPITVKEPGELQAVRETSVRSDVEGQATILYLIPEGSTVKTGEKLFELDVSEVVEKRANQKITVEKARNAWEQARTAAEILEKELTTKLNSAASQLRIAEMELEKLLGAVGDKANEGTNGDMLKRLRELVNEKPVTAAPVDASLQEEGASRIVQVAAVDPRNYANLVDKTLQLLQVPGAGDPLKRDMGDMANRILDQADKIRLAMADLSIKGDRLAYSRRLASKQFITRNELEGDELAYQSQISQVTLAWNRLDQLINYDLPVERIKAAQDFENAQLEMQRVEASNDAERKKSAFDVEAKQQEFDVAAERLANFNKQIDNAVVYAPTPGLVVYARVDRDRRGGEAVREGVSVRERQEIIVLPDNTKMRCIVKVQEAQIDKVAIGQRAHVTVEASPNEVLPGRVVRVAPVADSSSSWMGNDKKVYTTVIELDGENTDSRLRSRMAAAAAITIETVPDVIAVPQQSVRRDRSVNYVWKHTDKGPQAVRVVVGEHNQEKVQILDGVAEGDIVYRTPPGGVADPRFEQPALPEGVPVEADNPAAADPQAANAQAARLGGSDGAAPAGDAPGDRGAGGRSPGGRGPGAGAPGGGAPNGNGAPGGRQGRQGGGMNNKKFAEMTAEELEAYKGRLDGMQTMVDRFRTSAGEDVAKQMEECLAGIKSSLDGSDLETAQTHADQLRTLMRSAMGNRGGRGQGGGNSPGEGPGGGNQNRGG